MANTQDRRAIAIARMAKIELFLSGLTSEHEAAADYHRNMIVEECISKGKKDLLRARKVLFAGQIEECMTVLEIALLRINFGKQILEADAVEHILGESDYLELVEAPVPQEALIAYYFFQLEREVVKLYSQFKDEAPKT
jgi:hypothetical protein